MLSTALARERGLGTERFLGDVGDNARITDTLLSPLWVLTRGWWLLFLLSASGAAWLVYAMGHTFATGIGTWGNNIPVAWAFAITNFVWWIGIGHAGTFISAILLLLEQRWRTSINRFAEAMTLFAVANAGLFPVLHLGRPWFGYWLIPYPPTMSVWPNFKSALTWDIAAISTYGLISLVFWYVGLIPDFAVVRDRTKGLKRKVYAIFALGWQGSARHWRHYKVAYGLLGGLATPLVISVHSIVSMDFTIAQLPGWHSTIFPPYFVAGAIYSGFALVLTLMIPCRAIFRLKTVITDAHFDSMAKMLLVTGWVVTYTYLLEEFLAWYGGDRYEMAQMFRMRPFGDYTAIFWVMIACNCLVLQLLWVPSIRRNVLLLWLISVAINVGMWTERFVIIVTSLYHDFLPSSWHHYTPTWVDFSLLFGSMSFFLMLFLLFIKFVPFIPISECKEMKHEMEQEEQDQRRSA
jgi:molybdopterin-containing oxidoreductase family membrane subunit